MNERSGSGEIRNGGQQKRGEIEDYLTELTLILLIIHTPPYSMKMPCLGGEGGGRTLNSVNMFQQKGVVNANSGSCQAAQTPAVPAHQRNSRARPARRVW